MERAFKEDMRTYEPNEIVEKRQLAPSLVMWKLYVPEIAKRVKPGQFVVLRADDRGERIPLTVADFDREKGQITVIFQEVGASTKKLGTFEVGQVVLDVVGPLGKASHIEKFGTVVCIGGGVGVAPVYPIAKALYQAGNEIISIIGARSKDMLILEEEMKAISNKLFVTTDDGSYGHHGFVTDELKRLIDEKVKIDLVLAIGPVVMMRAVAEVTRPYNLKTIVSLNSVMIAGTGMCGGRRLETRQSLSASMAPNSTPTRSTSRNLCLDSKCTTGKSGGPCGIIRVSLKPQCR
jgi:NAD(P)H-flavin reductase